MGRDSGLRTATPRESLMDGSVCCKAPSNTGDVGWIGGKPSGRLLGVRGFVGEVIGGMLPGSGGEKAIPRGLYGVSIAGWVDLSLALSASARLAAMVD